jgi:hypothetical protein
MHIAARKHRIGLTLTSALSSNGLQFRYRSFLREYLRPWPKSVGKKETAIADDTAVRRPFPRVRLEVNRAAAAPSIEGLY